MSPFYLWTLFPPQEWLQSKVAFSFPISFSQFSITVTNASEINNLKEERFILAKFVTWLHCFSDGK
jgi:hypothetical protein